MTQKILVITCCAAALLLGYQPRAAADDESTNSTDRSSGWQEHHHAGGPGMGMMGRHMSRQDLRASNISGATVQDSSGQTLGTINDVVVNPGSGHIDFAIVSLSSSVSASGAGTSATTAGQLVPVPWMLLRTTGDTNSTSTSSSTSSSYSSASTSSQQPAFVYTGDTSKLQNAPSFSQSNWPDISQPAWRHSIYSYYGMKQMMPSATGGAESPGGVDISGARGGDQDLLRGNAATNSDTVTSPFSRSTNDSRHLQNQDR
jgi:sporulation protein YlmC with PRC-barrel domain